VNVYLKIKEINVRQFKYKTNIVRDSEGHTHPGPEHEAFQSLVSITSNNGEVGYCFGNIAKNSIENLIKPILVDEDPFLRERIWQNLKERQRLNLTSLHDADLMIIDMALWDLAGRALGQPVYKMLGGYRERVPAYASTMCGDEYKVGLDEPSSYAEFARWCQKRGYPAFKLHTWQPPIPGSPDVKRDIAACAAVREAVGPDMPLMLDPYHFYSREEALFLGKELEKLGFYWLEEPMNEHSMSSYIWLCENLSIPICGPETAEGKMFIRAEWVKNGASDILRGGVRDVGGITPLIKISHLAEAFGMRMEVHGGGPGNLHVLCAMGIPGEFYERGLLHPFIDYEQPQPWLNTLTDPMDNEGNVHISQDPGLGWDIDFDYINNNIVKEY
jgi:L-alanine-DL-glutamate epimerase-like enolase superfamily enzyme